MLLSEDQAHDPASSLRGQLASSGQLRTGRSRLQRVSVRVPHPRAVPCRSTIIRQAPPGPGGDSEATICTSVTPVFLSPHALSLVTETAMNGTSCEAANANPSSVLLGVPHSKLCSRNTTLRQDGIRGPFVKRQGHALAHPTSLVVISALPHSFSEGS